jgi:O-antigen/teichoic acid export membrane protein
MEPSVLLYYVLFKEINFLNIIEIKYITFVTASMLFFFYAVKNVTLKFNISDLISNLKIGVPNVPALLSKWMVKGSDRIFLINFYNLTAVGIYSANIKIERILATILIALNNTFFPDLVKEAKTENKNSKVFKLALIIFAIFSLAVIFFGKEFVLVFSKKDYFQSTLLFPLIAIYSYLFFVQHIFWPYIIVEKKINYAALVKFACSFLNIAANYFLIKYFSYIGAIWAILVSHLFIVIFLYKTLRKKISFFPILRNLGIFIIAAIFILLFQSTEQALSYKEVTVKFFAYLLSIFLLLAVNRFSLKAYFKKDTGKDEL